MVTGQSLRGSSLDALERIYCDAPMGPLPAGRFRGEVLQRVGTRFARSVAATALMLPFERAAFGVDFGRCTWTFFGALLRVGHFRVDPGRSRWRPAETLRLRYDVSRLPVRGMLYDEVKPLRDGLCLGLGGVNLARGYGDLFWFVLEARDGGAITDR